MKIKLTVFTEGGDEGVALLDAFIEKALSGVGIEANTSRDGDGIKVTWKKYQYGVFSARAFFPIPIEAEADAIVACTLGEDLSEKAINAWTLGQPLSCKSRTQLKAKHGFSNIESIYYKHTHMRSDFCNSDYERITTNAVRYTLHVFENEFVEWFKMLSKMNPGLTFTVKFKKSDWQPGDESDVLKNYVYEFENGITAYFEAKIIKNREPLNRSWRQGTPRRNIWNVVSHHIDDNGNLNQPAGEMPNGNRMEVQDREGSGRGSRFQSDANAGLVTQTLTHGVGIAHTNQPVRSTGVLSHMHMHEYAMQRESFQSMIERTINEYLVSDEPGPLTF